MPRKRTLGKGSRVSSSVSKAAPSHDKWQDEDDLRTLQRAEDIRSDSGRLARLRNLQQQQMAALDRVGRTLGTARGARGRSRSR